MPTLIRKPKAGLSLQLHTLDVSITHNQNCFDFPVHLHNGPNSPCMCSPNKQRKNKQQKEKIKQRTKCELVCVREKDKKRERQRPKGEFTEQLCHFCTKYFQHKILSFSTIYPQSSNKKERYISDKCTLAYSRGKFSCKLCSARILQGNS